MIESKGITWFVTGMILAWCLAVAFPAAGGVEWLWTYAPPEDAEDASIDASPAIADVAGDNGKEIIVTTTYGHIVALDRMGKEVWKTYVGDTLFLPPTLSDVTGDGRPEVLTGGRREKFVCLDAATGAVLWEWHHSGRIEWGTTAVAAADLDNDGVNEAVAGDGNGLVVCLEGDGSEAWRYAGRHGWTLCPAIGDLEGDGMLEVVLGGTEIPLVCLDHEGREKWRAEKPGKGASPVLADLDGDNDLEIITGVGNRLCLMDHTGSLIWEYGMAGHIDAAISVGDADQDGVPEVYAADLAGKFVKVKASGELEWVQDIDGRARRSPSIGDIDGDGVIEILVAGYDKTIHVFRPDGQLKALVPLDKSANGTPTLADLEGNGSLSIVCPAAWEGMKVFRWEGAPRGGVVLWPEYRLNMSRTAVYRPAQQEDGVRIASVDYGLCHVGKNRFAVEVMNPEKQALTVRLTVRLGNDEPCVSLRQSDGEVILHELPYTIRGEEAVELWFSCRVEWDAPGRVVLARAEHREYVKPFERELADIERALGGLEGALPVLPDPTFFRGYIDASRFRMPGYRERAASTAVLKTEELGTLRNEVASLWQTSTRYARLIASIREATGDDVPRVLLSAANPWAPLGGMDELAESRIEKPEVRVEAFSGEYENGALNVFSLCNDATAFRVELAAFKSETAPEGREEVRGADVVTLREALDVPTQDGDVSADAIPLLDQANVLIVPGWSARQLWLEFSTKALAPGNWDGELRLRSLEPSPLDLRVPLRVTVWPAGLPEEQPVTLCHWGYVHTSMLADQPEAALQDQIDHGTNVFVSLFAPKATYDEAGNIVGAIDFSEHDAYVRRHAPHGTILFCSYQYALKGPGGPEGEAYRRAHETWLKAWVTRLQELGVGYEGFALYPVDEPGLKSGLVECFLRYAKLAREGDPHVRIYADPVKRITMEELEAMAPCMDIWCPNSGSFLKFDCADKLAFMKAQDKPVWTYECSGNAKHQSPLGYYRGQAWLVWYRGLTGIGYWSYCTSSDDPWFRPEGKDYLLVYQGRGVVPSKRWKAVRDGIEDYSMLHVLRAAADGAEQAGRNPEAVAAARNLLQEDVWTIAEFCGIDDDTTLPGEGGMPQARRVADRRWDVIQATRRRIAELIAELAQP